MQTKSLSRNFTSPEKVWNCTESDWWQETPTTPCCMPSHVWQNEIAKSFLQLILPSLNVLASSAIYCEIRRDSPRRKFLEHRQASPESKSSRKLARNLFQRVRIRTANSLIETCEDIFSRKSQWGNKAANLVQVSPLFTIKGSESFPHISPVQGWHRSFHERHISSSMLLPIVHHERQVLTDFHLVPCIESNFSSGPLVQPGI